MAKPDVDVCIEVVPHGVNIKEWAHLLFQHGRETAGLKGETQCKTAGKIKPGRTLSRKQGWAMGIWLWPGEKLPRNRDDPWEYSFCAAWV